MIKTRRIPYLIGLVAILSFGINPAIAWASEYDAMGTTASSSQTSASADEQSEEGQPDPGPVHNAGTGDGDDSGISLLSLARSAGNSWSKNGNTYTATDGTTVTNAQAMGIDVSRWQGNIDWKTVSQSGLVDYAIIRCGYGDNVSSQDDEQFINNVRGCQQYGIPFGVYIYSYASDVEDAQDEAEHVLRLLDAAGLSSSTVQYPIYYDLEYQGGGSTPAGLENGIVRPLSNDTLLSIARTFCSMLESRGYRAGIYANLNWWNNYLTSSEYNQWSRWVAQYNTSCSYTGSYDMWQCMSDGVIPGISGNVDINFDFAGLNKYLTMYRLRNPYTGEHLYSGDPKERNTLVSVGWQLEGYCWTSPKSGVRVRRLYNPNNGDHLYVAETETKEINACVAAGWKLEGTAWYSSDSGVPIYRVYQFGTGAHLYTTSLNEGIALQDRGWKLEGIAFYSIAL